MEWMSIDWGDGWGGRFQALYFSRSEPLGPFTTLLNCGLELLDLSTFLVVAVCTVVGLAYIYSCRAEQIFAHLFCEVQTRSLEWRWE